MIVIDIKIKKLYEDDKGTVYLPIDMTGRELYRKIYNIAVARSIIERRKG